MDIKILQQKLLYVENMLASLEEAIKEPKTSFMRDSVIKRFEFTFESFWKMLKKILSYEGQESTSPRDAIRKAYQDSMISDEKIWLNMIDDRNKTSHIYSEEEADIIYNNIVKHYYSIMSKTYLELKNRIKTYDDL